MQNIKLFKNYILRKNLNKYTFFNHPIKNYTTIGTGGNAGCFIELPGLDILRNVFEFICKNEIKYNVIGNGSNLLVSEKGFDDVVISLKKIPQKLYCESNYLFVSANIEVSHLLKMCQKYGLSGLEFLSGIPGTIGGVVEMNAGAFDHSIAEMLKEIVIINENGELEKISSENIHFNYRKIDFKRTNYIIIEAVFKIKREPPKKVEDLCKEYFFNRSSKFLLGCHTFGSVFKNGDNYYAGELLEKCGLKGYRIGDAQISEKHANFIINIGKATSNDIYKLIKIMRMKVFKKFNIKLETEVKFWGDFSDAD